MCITSLVTLYYIYTPTEHFGVFTLHYLPPFQCQHDQLTFHILGKYSYYFTYFLQTTLRQMSSTFWGGGRGVIHPVTLTNADDMAPQFSSSYFWHDSWSIFHFPSYNSPWDTHLPPPENPPPLYHEVQRDWEASWWRDVPSPIWGEVRIPKTKRWYKGIGKVYREISRLVAVQSSLYHDRIVDLKPEPVLLHFPVGPGFRAQFRIAWMGADIRLNSPPTNRLHFLGIVPPTLHGTVSVGEGKYNKGVREKCRVRSNWIDNNFRHFQEWCLSRSLRVTVHISRY